MSPGKVIFLFQGAGENTENSWAHHLYRVSFPEDTDTHTTHEFIPAFHTLCEWASCKRMQNRGSLVSSSWTGYVRDIGQNTFFIYNPSRFYSGVTGI